MHLVPLEPQHLHLIRPQPAQASELDLTMLATVPGHTWTAVHDGLPMCCGGLVPHWEGRAYAWTILDVDAAPHLLALTRAIRCLLDGSGWRRIEMAVDADFAAGCRWARLLGFEHETLARRYFPNGHDAHVFVRL